MIQPGGHCSNTGLIEGVPTLPLRSAISPSREVTPPGLPTWGSLTPSSVSLGQSGISGGLIYTRAHDRLNLSRLIPGITLNLTSFSPLGVTPSVSMSASA